MRTIAIANQKGGTCKTTSAVNLAAALGRKQRVLVIDLDPQANASDWLGVSDEERGKGLLEALVDEKPRPLAELVAPTDVPGVDLIASSAWLRKAEIFLAGEPAAEKVLRRAMGALPRRRWDVVLIDCAPSLGVLTKAALVASGEVVAPVEASTMATKGLRDLMRTIERIREDLNRSLRTTAILPCRVDERRGIDCDVVDSVRSKLGALVTKQVIHESARIKEACSHQKPLEQYAPSSRAAQEFRAAATEIIRRRTN